MSTTDQVAAAASIPDALPLDETTLLGVFMGNGTATALLRTGRGEILTVAPGDSVGRERVTAIGPDMIRLAEGGSERELTLPEG